MLPELDKIKEYLSFEILKYEVINYGVHITVRKNGEELLFTFFNTGDLKHFLKYIEKHIKYGTLQTPTEKLILETMLKTKSDKVLLDSNFNFIECMNQKNYNTLCKQAQVDFMREKEKWAVAQIINKKLLRFVDNNEISDYKEEWSEDYPQKTYIADSDNQFVYVPKNTARMRVDSEMMFLFYKTPNTNKLSINLTYNSSWAY